MFMDDINNRYTYLNTLKNVVWEQSKDAPAQPEGVTVLIRPELDPVIERLTKDRPTWRFKSTERLYSGPDVRWLGRFFIYDGDEVLGELHVEHHWRDGTPRFYFDNHRLAKARMKNQKNFTTKPDVAAKRIIKAFHLKTPKERAAEAFTNARDAVREAAGSVDWPLRKAKNVIERGLFAYAVRHWDAIKDEIGEDASKLDLPALVQAHQEGLALMNAINDKTGVVVRAEANGTYLACRAENETYTVETYTDATLPDSLRGGLGLLKMMPEGAFIADVGVRAKNNTYFIMDRKEKA